ncbi:unnamed protein product [Thlaspi arvense]|uniref:At1g68980-like TPR repeats domain-containing protein n=1 Tax=Thlaspi arvense TaxID=13288 RepID=A0AAU9RXD8_THLAR|nr:unnamed protein product [Thlaspi arvense]
MWRRTVFLLSQRRFSSETEVPSLYSFLRPSIFALRRDPDPPPPKPQDPPSQTLSVDGQAALETTLQSSIHGNDIDEAWKSFKTLTSSACFPSKPLTNSLISYLSSFTDTHNLKRAFASVVFLLEKNPKLLEHRTIETLLIAMKHANTANPAFALVKCMFKNRFFMPFDLWGDTLVEISRKNGRFEAFLCVFNENCRICLDEKLHFMRPNLAACNAALEGCCRELESVSDAESVVETMSVLGIRPDECSFGFLAYLYALKGLEEKINELRDLMSGFGLVNKKTFLSNLISGYVRSGNLDSVSETILLNLSVDGEGPNFSNASFCEVVKGFLQNGSIKDLANLIIRAPNLEAQSVMAEQSVGYGIVCACVDLGFLDKAHSILDEMKRSGLFYWAWGLCANFESLLDMREARIPDLQVSYLTIMTGLTENNRPELMAAFLDEVVEDPRVEVGTHDWNSIIHAFCKAGRVEDARRTFRRMIFLQFVPNDQTYLSLINGYVAADKYFNVLMLWNEVKRRVAADGDKRFKLEHNLVDAFLYALVKGGFFDAVMQVVEKSQEMKIFVDK